MGNKSSTTTQTTQQSSSRSPWAPTVQPLTGIVQNAETLAGDPSRWTPQYSGTTMAGIAGLENAAANGSGAFSALNSVVPGSTAGFGTGLGQLSQAAQGGYLNANPYFDAALNASRDQIANRVNSQFTGAGRYGSGAHAGTLTRELGNLEAQARFQNYNTERGAQDAAARTLYGGGFQGASMGGALDQAEINPALLQLQAGNLRDQMLNASRTAPMSALEWQSRMTTPIAGLGGDSTSTGTQTSQTVQPTNWLTTGLGIGQMGLGMLTAPGGASLMGTAAAPTLLGGMTGYFR